MRLHSCYQKNPSFEYRCWGKPDRDYSCRQVNTPHKYPKSRVPLVLKRKLAIHSEGPTSQSQRYDASDIVDPSDPAHQLELVEPFGDRLALRAVIFGNESHIEGSIRPTGLRLRTSKGTCSVGSMLR
ncbi:hypothetical protein M513_10084 [Trichuris suis]|uniref:Uncharacterized protein n=1 Tax=Trichuris suis TaxID=68888 RepID=A0A085LVP0_9BILA|nr:hypothetical protein M513_10084 [Trichuris suis]